MGTAKKEKNRRTRQGTAGDGLGNVKVKGENFYRSAKKVKTLNMYKEGKPQRNAAGKITQAAPYQSREVPNARIEPNRKWFTNTRVISQENLKAFREAMAEKATDPYQVLLKTNRQLPMTLLKEPKGVNGLKVHPAKMTVESTPFSEVFGGKAQRKRVKIGAGTFTDLVGVAEKSLDTYQEKREEAELLKGDDEDGIAVAKEPIFNKGGSKRIWNELYKVLDSSDVVIHVLDARDPLGTRCRSVEKYLKAEAPHKHLIFVLNKCDLVPTTVAAAWVRTLSKDYPCLAFHASINHSFGKGSLISLLRQFSQLHAKNRKEISVGMIGYPNVGKSSIINTLRKKKVCTVAPIPGETKVWQYISLMKRISLIDCPGIVPPNMNDTPEDLLLRGVVRIENVEHPSQYIPALMNKVKKHHLERTYEIRGWEDSTNFLEQLARKGGRLLKGGEPDIEGVSKMVVHDFLRGKIPWFTPCPQNGDSAAKGIEGREGRFGEMPRRRKFDEMESVGDASTKVQGLPGDDIVENNEATDEESEFGGFDSGEGDGENEDYDDDDASSSLSQLSVDEEESGDDPGSEAESEDGSGRAEAQAMSKNDNSTGEEAEEERPKKRRKA